MMLADQLVARGVAVNIERLLRMALLHDWSEARVGDMPRTANAYFGDLVRKNAETAAFADMIIGTGGDEALYREIHEDYEQRKTLEARLVKAADVIDLLVQALALERAGARGLDEFWEILKTGDFQLEGIANEIIRDIFNSLLNARSALN
jgi:putative hydrolase of HD superfamily